MARIKTTEEFKLVLGDNAQVQERLKSFLKRMAGSTFSLKTSRFNESDGMNMLRERLTAWLNAVDFLGETSWVNLGEFAPARAAITPTDDKLVESSQTTPSTQKNLNSASSKAKVKTMAQTPAEKSTPTTALNPVNSFTKRFINVVQWNARVQAEQRELFPAGHFSVKSQNSMAQNSVAHTQNTRVKEFLTHFQTENNAIISNTNFSENLKTPQLQSVRHVQKIVSVTQKSIQNTTTNNSSNLMETTTAISPIVHVFKLIKTYETRYSALVFKTQTNFSETLLARERAAAKESVVNHYHGCFNTIRQENTIGAEMGEIGSLIRQNLVEVMEKNLRFNAISAEATAGT